MSYADEVLKDRPLAYWRLGESGGAVAMDASPNAQNGSYSASGVGFGTPGAMPADKDTAVTLDGVSGQMTLTPVMQLAPGQPFTIEAWVKPAGSGIRTIFQATQGIDHLLMWLEGNHSLWCRISSATGFPFTGTAAESVPNGAWSHVAITYDGTTGRFYINGALRTAVSLNAPGSAATSGIWRIGSWAASNYYNGVLDEVAIYPIALSAARMLTHYQVGTQPTPAPIPPLVVPPVVITPSSPVRAYPIGKGSYQGIAWGRGLNLQVQSWQDDALPEVRGNDTARTHQDGDWTGDDSLASRLIQATFVLFGRDNYEYRQWLYALEHTWLPGTDAALFMMDNTRLLNARLRKRLFEHYQGGREKVGLVHVEWYAADPVEYDASDPDTGLRRVTMPLGSLAEGGRVYNLVFDRVYPAMYGSGTAIATNQGNKPARWRMVIYGPCTNPRVYNQTTGQVMSFNGVLDANSYLEIDATKATILLNSDPAAPRYSWLVLPDSEWWLLQPGDNSLRYSADAAGGSSKTELYWRNPIV